LESWRRYLRGVRQRSKPSGRNNTTAIFCPDSSKGVFVEQGLNQTQSLRQEQILAPQQIQSLEVLLAPVQELQAKISAEIAENPTLEQETPGNEDLAGDVIAATKSSQLSDTEEERRNSDDDGVAEIMRLAESWRDSMPVYNPGAQFTSDDAEKRQFMFDTLTEEPSLQDQLLEQLRFADVDDDTRRLAELVIGSIDDSGYLRSILEDLATVGGASVENMREALELVRSFDPPGIGASNLGECLLLQLERQGKGRSSLAKLVRNHLDDIAANKLPKVAREMGVSMEELRDLLDKLKTLTPYPGSALSPNKPFYIVPEVSIEKNDSAELTVKSESNHLPKLRVSQYYLKLLEDPTVSKETKDYIRGKLSNSKALIKSISQRQDTITRIAEVILDEQYDFFKYGVDHLKPLTMQQVADKLGIHETTVSRAIANKYLNTPKGLLPFKYFFSTGYQSSDGEEISSRGVMEKIKDMIAKEDPSTPLSDLKITEELKKEGLSVARRTVAKYRESLGIPSSHLRKEY